MSEQLDYTPDALPSFPTEIKGNSAEGFVLDQAMEGYGKHSAISRPGFGDAVGAPGAFIQGNNPGNYTPAGEEMSGNKVFNPGEK